MKYDEIRHSTIVHPQLPGEPLATLCASKAATGNRKDVAGTHRGDALFFYFRILRRVMIATYLSRLFLFR
jgi:hypothetical protein